MNNKSTPVMPNKGSAKWTPTKVANRPERPTGNAKSTAAKSATNQAELTDVTPNNEVQESGYSQHTD